MPRICVYESRESSDETALVAVRKCSIFCVCEQGRFWRDCTRAQSHLSLCWSLMPRIVYECKESSGETALMAGR